MRYYVLAESHIKFRVFCEKNNLSDATCILDEYQLKGLILTNKDCLVIQGWPEGIKKRIYVGDTLLLTTG